MKVKNLIKKIEKFDEYDLKILTHDHFWDDLTFKNNLDIDKKTKIIYIQRFYR